MYKHILIPTDGSELATRAVDEGLKFAKWAKATVTCLLVTPHMHVAQSAGLREAVDKMMERAHEDDIRKHAEEVLEPVRQRAEAAGVVCVTLNVVSDQTADTIIDTAGKRGCDLIIMASHGRGGVKAVLLGSTSTQVLAGTKLPVLVLR